ncbi:acetyl-CoA synthetase-like protein [Xylariaceae sp. FL1272]|nr:acetyl-CoA synthetase-like protein [Xylariaceae sp. FL1272]
MSSFQSAIAHDSSARCLADSLKPSPKDALHYPSHRAAMSFRMLHDFVQTFNIPITSRGPLSKPIVAIVLPNGPLLAATIIAVANVYVAAPINTAAGPDQVKSDLHLSGATAIVSCEIEASRLGLDRIGLDLFFVEEDEHAGVRLNLPPQSLRLIPNGAQDIALVLFTSGTSGKRKVVPITVESLHHGVQLVIESWNLTEEDTCLNMMPLFHVGGIVRNLFAPLFSGGSTICCPNFDPNLFWDLVEDVNPTWYYASPTMHSMILEEGKSRSTVLQKSKIRLVCNAAGSLLPTLAEQLRDTFQSTVLPSYGMTECMPISTPPIPYDLSRPGTSGVATGPDLAILDASGNELPALSTGRICLRGSPVFQGYLKPDGTTDRSIFDSKGWFDTGDIGYLDKDQYLFITGRSKEVINRGGELISPFEVENAIIVAASQKASPTFERISQALAFSVRHETLQEVVGVALVTPLGKPRVGLQALRESIRATLQQAKWPVLIVYMNDLPKRNNKLLRIGLAERLGLPCMNDAMPYSERHCSAQCPPTDADLTVIISSRPCVVTANDCQQQINHVLPPYLEVYVEANTQTNHLTAVLAPKTSECEAPNEDAAELFKSSLTQKVHGYLLPQTVTFIQRPFPRDRSGSLDLDELSKLLQMQRSNPPTDDSMAGKLVQMFAVVLQLDASDVSSRKDFFALGGDSLRAGKLLSMIRSEFSVRIPIDFIFRKGSIENLAGYIKDRTTKQDDSSSGSDIPSSSESAKMYSSTNPILLLLQLLPIMVFYPFRRALTWTFFIYALVYSNRLPTSLSLPGRLLNVVLSIFFARVASRVVLPLVGIIAKWLIIGRITEGLYPMWGPYHTRWWLTQKIVMICGKGVFGLSESSKTWYYRLLGARIGSGVTIKGAQLGEWDLLDISDNVTLDGCIVRPMAGEHNTTMYLGRITIGKDSSVGIGSVVAAGSSIPNNTCIGPRSCSWEYQDAAQSNRDLSNTKAPKPHWALLVFVSAPICAVSRLVFNAPWLGGLVGLVQPEALPRRSALITILNWFAEGERIAWYYLARTLRTFFGPIVLFCFGYVVRQLLLCAFGALRPSESKKRRIVDTWRMDLMKSLIPNSLFHELTGLWGHHYEATSIAIRLLGGKVGRRVYWPGTGPSITQYEMLDVGNDVVFGSRSHLITSDGTGSEPIIIKDGAMIADRVVALPGVTIGARATLGSGCLTQRNKTYESQGVYVGSKAGDSIFLGVRQQTETDRYDLLTNKHDADKPVHLKEVELSVNEKSSSSPTVSVFTQSTKDLESGYDLTPVDSNHSQTNGKDTSEAGLNADEYMSPFGRAFYEHKAPYFVWRQWMIFLYSSFTVVFTDVYWSAASISSIQIVAIVFTKIRWLGNGHWSDPFCLFALCTALLSFFVTAQSIVALSIVITAKWSLLGRRQPGNFDWDKSSYCQRWQLFLAIERIRRRCFAGHGILSMLTGTAYMSMWYVSPVPWLLCVIPEDSLHIKANIKN